MTIATLNDVLRPAVSGRYALAGLVVLGWEDARAFVEAADETGIPIILQAGPGCRKYTPVSILGKMFRTLAEQARVPVVCHIDHAYTQAECEEGIDCGFTSVMIDGSKLEIGENIALTASVVERAHRAGVSVEGEVGVVGYVGSAASAMTLPDEARRFDQESGADALAVSVGNVHLSTEKTHGIDFEALRAIEAVTRMPLVLHGGSGIPPAIRRQLARQTRVKKFNIGTELRMAFGKALRKSLADHPDSFDRIELLKATIPAIREEAAYVLRGLTAD
jgi:fructose-bisphosphate aldolase, class II